MLTNFWILMQFWKLFYTKLSFASFFSFNIIIYLVRQLVCERFAEVKNLPTKLKLFRNLEKINPFILYDLTDEI